MGTPTVLNTTPNTQAGTTEAQVLSELQNRMYAAILNDAQFNSVVTAALRDLNRYCPVNTIAKFNTLTEIQDYYIFNPLDQAPPAGYPQISEDISNNTATYVVPPPLIESDGTVITYTGTNGIAQGAMEIEDIIWNPGGDFSSLNVFSPGWQLLSQTIIYSGSYFNNPAMMMVLNQKLNAFKNQFGGQGWDLYGQIDNPTSFIRIYPLPLESQSPVIIKFTQGNTLGSIQSKQLFYYFMQWVEYRYCEALANFFAQSAGIEICGFTDPKYAMVYFDSKAKRKYDEAVATQSGINQGVVERN